ncbi:MAG: sensor histidine kinase [Gammaproteobacteria bacterium]|nr:sensor histidine kinase [Gammaproteobacteria bacterium]
MADHNETLEEGKLSFSIEARIVRELGERLVKKPEVALLELIKNAFDADAPNCTIKNEYPDRLLVEDSGHGMTLDDFKNGWMRIGTGFKDGIDESREFGRAITGEKGIGRFAVRYLGKRLVLRSVAHDHERGFSTVLKATFNWPAFDHDEDLGRVTVPYSLSRAQSTDKSGTTLTISELRDGAKKIDFGAVKTAALGSLSPYHSLLPKPPKPIKKKGAARRQDPGFTLTIVGGDEDGSAVDVAGAVLDNFVLRCTLEVRDSVLKLRIFERGQDKPSFSIDDQLEKYSLDNVDADIRYFPARQGTFTGLSVDGRSARTWAKDNSGVAVFDRDFRVYPYGTEGDDWLSLALDKSRSERDPRSTVSAKYFPMSAEQKSSTELNYMLVLPSSYQLIGAVRVEGTRSSSKTDDKFGLVAVADREGFVDNRTFQELVNIVRGGIEAIAYVDRELQQQEEAAEQKRLMALLKRETRDAIKQIEANPNISTGEKRRIVQRLANTEELIERQSELSKKRATALETMSLLGVVAGFMTHEFGSAIDHLEESHTLLIGLAKRDPSFKPAAAALAKKIEALREFVTYTQGYIRGATNMPNKAYPARPRILQVVRVFGKYAEDRKIKVDVHAEADVMAPPVPVSLYGGILLNLYTNALKAITSKVKSGPRRITFQVWNEGNTHFLQVADTGVGIPNALKSRIFESLFTTTDTNRDPLGSGMGLGLSLIQRGIENFGGKIAVTTPPPGFTTCFRVQLPLKVKA